MRKHLAVIGCSVCLLGLMAGAGRGDEARGVISDTQRGGGAFNLTEKDTVRLFNLSAKKSEYEPASWRPTKGDKVDVTYHVTQGHSRAILEVEKVKLVKAGPETIVMESPVKVEIMETGHTGIKAKLSAGQTVKFDTGRHTQWDPVGWVPTPGQKAKVTFHTDKAFFGFGFGISYQADKIQKVD